MFRTLLLLFIGSAVKGNEEKLAEAAVITNETELKTLAQVVCKPVPRTSFSLLLGYLPFGVLFSFGIFASLLGWNYVEGEERNEVDLAVVENVAQTQLRPSRLIVDLMVEKLPSVEIQPEGKPYASLSQKSVQSLGVDETEGKPSDEETTLLGESLEPKIILEDLGVGERPQDKINERKPMIFVGGVSASTTPIELVSEFRKQGFNVTVLPRIRYGVSFGFCPDLVLSSVEEVEELLALERVWVKDRWVDIRPYIPKDCPTVAVASQQREAKEEKENVEYINVEDLLNSTPSLQETWKPYISLQGHQCGGKEQSPIHFGQPYLFPLGSPIYVPQQFYPQHPPELPFMNSHAMQTLDTFQQQPISQSNSMQSYSSH